MRLALDTTTVTSAVRSSRGASRELVAAALRRDYTLLLSVALALEYEDVLSRPEHLAVSELSEQGVKRLILALLGVAVKVDPGPYVGRPSVDPNDTAVLALVAHGAADALVKNNTRHFLDPCRELGVNLWKPSEALTHLRRQNVRDDAN